MKEQDKTHWMQSPNKNYLGHWDLPESGELVVTIESAKWEAVKNPITGKTESKRVIRFKENIKPMICNQTNAQSIVKSTGVKFMEDSSGVQICLYVDTIKDKISKEDLDCIRIRKNNPYTLAALEKLFNEKRTRLKDNLIERTQQIIIEEESSSYKKAIDILSKI